MAKTIVFRRNNPKATRTQFERKRGNDDLDPFSSIPLSKFQSLLHRLCTGTTVPRVSGVGQLHPFCGVYSICVTTLVCLSANALSGHLHWYLVYRFHVPVCKNPRIHSH